MLWHYTVGRSLSAYIDAMEISTQCIELCDPPKCLVWLSENPNWEPHGHGSIERPDGSFVMPNKQQLDAIAHGLYRIEVDDDGSQLDWQTLIAGPDIRKEAVAAIEATGIEIAAIPAEWRFELTAIPQARWKNIERWDSKDSLWVPESLAGNNLVAGTNEMFAAIDRCIQDRYAIASLILIYSTIDSLAWLAIPDLTSQTSEAHFCAWLDTYLLPTAFEIRCESIDLFGARCGLLHTRSAISTKSASQKAKQIMYAWGGQTRESLQKYLDLHPTEKTIGIHVRDLFSELVKAFARFQAALSNDPVQSRIVRAKSLRVFTASGESLELTRAAKELGLPSG